MIIDDWGPIDIANNMAGTAYDNSKKALQRLENIEKILEYYRLELPKYIPTSIKTTTTHEELCTELIHQDNQGPLEKLLREKFHIKDEPIEHIHTIIFYANEPIDVQKKKTQQAINYLNSRLDVLIAKLNESLE